MDKEKDFHQLKILIIDTDEKERNRLQSLLGSRSDVHVRTSDMGDGFLDILGKARYDLLIIEMIPSETVLSRYIREIKQMKHDQDFILTCSNPGYEDVMFSLKEGAIDFFERPVSHMDLNRVLQKHRYRIIQNRFSDRVDKYTVYRDVRMKLPTDISILSYAAGRIADEIFYSGVIPPSRFYHLNLALFEALTNALEHGNLEIGYDEKTGQIERGDYLSVIENLCALDPYKDRKIHVHYIVDEKSVIVEIEDEGKGFDSEHFLKKASAVVNEDFHGRGLYLIMKTMDRMWFNEQGNKLTFVLNRS